VLGTERSAGCGAYEEHLPWHGSPTGHGGGKTPHRLVPSGLYCGISLVKVKLSDKKVKGSGNCENEGELLVQKRRGASMRGCGSRVALSNSIPNKDGFKTRSSLLPVSCLFGSCT